MCEQFLHPPLSSTSRISSDPLFLSCCYPDHLSLHSFPTRRSSDLSHARPTTPRRRRGGDADVEGERPQDRKSTRLNSSHLVISYAVFCLKKKKSDEIVHSTHALY